MEEESHILHEEGFVLLKPRAYHIGQAAVEICNAYELPPAETIVRLRVQLLESLSLLEERDKMISSLKNIVPTDGRPVYTLQEFGDVMRKVTQVEGVTLNEKQKGFFRDLFVDLTMIITGRKP